MSSFRIFTQPWNKEKMDLWSKPIEHIGANCSELAISYLGLTTNQVCIRDSLENYQRGNYGRLTDEIETFFNEHADKYSWGGKGNEQLKLEDTYKFTADDFLYNTSRLAKIIGKGKETLIFLNNHFQNIGHCVVLAVIDSPPYVTNGDNQLFLLETSKGEFYSGSTLIEYLTENGFYTPELGIVINFLHIHGKKRPFEFITKSPKYITDSENSNYNNQSQKKKKSRKKYASSSSSSSSSSRRTARAPRKSASTSTSSTSSSSSKRGVQQSQNNAVRSYRSKKKSARGLSSAFLTKPKGNFQPKKKNRGATKETRGKKEARKNTKSKAKLLSKFYSKSRKNSINNLVSEFNRVNIQN